MTAQLLVDGPAIARDLGLDPALLRQWARRGHLHRHGTDSAGRSLLDYDEVEQLARERGLLADAGTVGPMSAWSLQPDRPPHVWAVVNVSGKTLTNVRVRTEGAMVAGLGRRNWETEAPEVEPDDYLSIGGVAFAGNRDLDDPEHTPRIRVTFDGDATGLSEVHDFPR